MEMALCHPHLHFQNQGCHQILVIFPSLGRRRQYYGQKLSSKAAELNGDGYAERRADSIPRVEIVVNSDAFWMRLFLFADMGFAESYMLGEFECADLTAFFKVRGARFSVDVGILN